MTLDEIRKSDKELLVPREVAEILHCDPYKFTLEAKRCPEKLGFPVCVIGTRVRVPKIPFLRFLGVDV